MAYNDKNMVNDYNGHKIPQYYNPVTDKYEPLHGADGVSFVGNHVLSPGGVWIPQTGNDDGSINTRLTGSIVEEIIFDNVEVRDTDWVSKTVPKMINRYDLVIYSTLETDLRLDVNVRTSVFPLGATRVFSADGSNRVTLNISESDLSGRLIIPFNQIKVRGEVSINIRPSEAPTTGSLSVVLYSYE